MKSAAKKDFTFHVGICMAGAISAGAYTAGVMDYLLEALEHWEKAKELQKEGKLKNIPKHDFLIEVLGGASAGGMTAAITAAATQIKFEPVTQNNEDDVEKTSQNPLYSAWINLTETADSDMMDQMLNTDDIEKDETQNGSKEVRAAFNSTFIKKVADSVLDKSLESAYKRPYIAEDIDIFTTVTNLRGFDYNVKFETSSGIRQHRMKMHRDYAFFKFSEKDDRHISQPIADGKIPDSSTEISVNDGRIPVNFNFPKGLNVEILKQAAMSTGAFPVGLESRDLLRRRDYIEHNKYLNLMLSGHGGENVNYSLTSDKDENFLTLNVDGGVINNEPYEITQQLLDDRRANSMSKENPAVPYSVKTSASEFDSIVLMIDPFPNDEDAEEEYVPKKAWRHVLPSILSAMRGQLMMKDEQIKRAYLSEDYTRFLVMPVRTHDKQAEKFAIACGSLGGFGGFFSKKFRSHDFHLGRRNCQRFLQQHFTVPTKANNPILTFGFEESTEFGYSDVKSKNTYMPILPDMRVIGDDENGYKIIAPPEEKEYKYPKIELSYLLSLKSKIEKRIGCVLDNIRNVEIGLVKKTVIESVIVSRIRQRTWKDTTLGRLIRNFFLNLYLGIGKYFGKKAAADACMKAIITDMEKRNLIRMD